MPSLDDRQLYVPSSRSRSPSGARACSCCDATAPSARKRSPWPCASPRPPRWRRGSASAQFHSVWVDAPGVSPSDPGRAKVELHQPMHTYEFFHYYIGAKYFRELGYEGLYDCTALADAEIAAEDHVRPRIVGWVRDLDDVLRDKTYQQARQHCTEDIRPHFTNAEVGLLQERHPRAPAPGRRRVLARGRRRRGLQPAAQLVRLRQRGRERDPHPRRGAGDVPRVDGHRRALARRVLRRAEESVRPARRGDVRRVRGGVVHRQLRLERRRVPPLHVADDARPRPLRPAARALGAGRRADGGIRVRPHLPAAFAIGAIIPVAYRAIPIRRTTRRRLVRFGARLRRDGTRPGLARHDRVRRRVLARLLHAHRAPRRRLLRDAHRPEEGHHLARVGPARELRRAPGAGRIPRLEPPAARDVGVDALARDPGAARRRRRRRLRRRAEAPVRVGDAHRGSS